MEKIFCRISGVGIVNLIEMSETDLALLARYTRQKAEDAFTELVHRHLNLVYSAALRQVRSPQLAEEIAQSTFVKLARNAPQLAPDTILTAWLYQVTYREAINVGLREARRKLREQIATEMNAINATADDWLQIEPILDEAMHALDDTDRAAILLRFFEHKLLREVGQALGTSEDGAQKRVSRAIERLREFLAKRGATISVNGLAVLIAANAVEAAPVGLAAALAAAALSGTTIISTTISTAGRTIILTTMQKSLLTLVLLALIGTTTYKAYHGSKQPNEPDQAGLKDSAAMSSSNNPKRLTIAAPTVTRTTRRVARDFAKLAADLRKALYAGPPSRHYPPDEVTQALSNYGTDRKEAFATLREAADDPDNEVRTRSISAMGLVGAPARPGLALIGIVGDPAPEAKPLLWKVLLQDKDLAYLALNSLRTIGFDANEIPALTDLMSHTANDQLLRYVPEAIAKTIQTDPARAAAFISSLETLLNSSKPRIQFEAACALAKHEAARNPQILSALVTGLCSKNNFQELMALETLQTIGPAAEPALQAVLAFADATSDKVMKDVAFTTIGKIKADLRSALPEVEQVLKRQENIANWSEKFMSGNYTYQDLVEALQEPAYAQYAAKKLGEMGPSAKETIPYLISALAGQDQTKRQQIEEAIHKIDPTMEISKVNSRAIASAAKMARLTLQARDGGMQLPSLLQLLRDNEEMNSAWRTREELVDLAKQISAQDQETYQIFVGKLIEVDPSLTNLFARQGNN